MTKEIENTVEREPRKYGFGQEDVDPQIKARSERLRHAVQEAGGNALVASKSGIPLGTLNRYIAGREMKAGAMIAIARACGVSLSWLAEGAGPSALETASSDFSNVEIIPDQSTLNVRYFDIDASAGFGRLDCDQEKPIYMPIFRAVLEMAKCVAKDTIVMHAVGDSMSPTINSGDAMVIDTRRTDQLFGIYVFVMHGAVFVKRLSARTDGTILVSSDNKNYPPEEVSMASVRWGQPDGADSMCIVGRVAMIMTSTL
ncbi:hypothetical protein FOH24_13070 [Acetobacter tropicalis]|uniref:LexA family transcriptional regulator n=1 Tax=Acetobacter tropicalis TaxID=104102 RepID=UPI00068F51E0|nr:S24 family peptidase [Acetobacter tropicalis]KAA8387908.1 hypothetical protein FOH24_13070 [Acetobacter tropicalis]KAA8388821.1 hypothetical protein FOH22_08380 [Acetobacter tropicalis]MDO8172339.1 S24 family peptidase [Acetobacter tropicalis]